MPRRNRKQFNRARNKGSHQRRRSTRGARLISKFVKYKWYGDNSLESMVFHNKNPDSQDT